MKYLFGIFVILFGLVGCVAIMGNDDTDDSANESGVVDNSNGSTSNDEKKPASEKKKQSSKFSNVIVADDDKFKITLTGLKQDDSFLGKEADVKIEIVNKTNKTIEVQSRDISVDGIMFDDDAMFSTTVAPGKTAKDEISFMQMDESDEFPEFKDSMEGRIVVIDIDTFNDLGSYDFNVKFK